MAERNSSSTGTNRGTDRGNTAASTSVRGADTSTARQNTITPTAQAAQPTARASGSESHDQSIAGKVRERAAAQLTTQKDRALDGLGGVAHAVRSTTQSLRDTHHETIAGYVDQAADQIDRLSRNLKQKDVGELVSDAQRLARRQPALFVGSALAIGLLGARFFKSSPPDRQVSSSYRGNYRTGSEPSAYSTERF